MKRPVAITVLFALLILPSSLHAQIQLRSRSFGSGPIGMAPHVMMPVGMGPVGLRPRGSPFRASPARPLRTRSPRAGIAPIDAPRFVTAPSPAIAPGYFAGTPCRTNPSYAGSFFCSQYRMDQRPGFGAAAFAPIYWISPVDYSQAEVAPAPQSEPDNAIVAQVQDLTDEVEMLREEQLSRMESAAREAEASTSVPEEPLKTVLVYRDGHKSEVQNYAILGKTLWVFAGQTTRKVPLAQLDLDGTIKLNDDRGVEFVSPGTL